jgi:hypothetical protein
MRRRLVWGGAAVAVYVAAALAVARTGTVVPRPVYDGLAPAAAYRFVSPPPDLAAANEPPEPGDGVVDLIGKGSAATSISTGDGQMQVVFQKGTFPASKGEKTIEVAIEPLEPPPPQEVEGGLRIEGNAYRVNAVYAKSGDRARPQRTLTAVLRYPSNATAMVRREGNGWTKLKTQSSVASLQLFAETDEIGMFAAAGKPHRTWTRWVPYGAAGLGLVAGIIGYLSGRRGWFRRRKRTRQQQRQRARNRKRKR